MIEILLLGESPTAEWEQDPRQHQRLHQRQHQRQHHCPPETDRSQAGERPEQSQPRHWPGGLLPCGAWWPAESVPRVSAAAAAAEDVSARPDVSDVVPAPAPPATTSTVAETVQSAGTVPVRQRGSCKYISSTVYLCFNVFNKIYCIFIRTSKNIFLSFQYWWAEPVWMKNWLLFLYSKYGPIGR